MINKFKKIRNPVQYLGLDINTVKKEWDNTNVKFLLAFPDMYEIGSSNLGIQILYHIINSEKNFLCDRIFAPDIKKELLLNKSIPYLSLDNGKPPLEFDIIGFSLQYEMSYPTVLSMLRFMDIPLNAEERIENNSIPIICAGGTTVFNPLPMKPFFDFFLIGDGEDAVIEKCKILDEMKGNKKIDILRELSRIEGVYSPFFKKNIVKRRIMPEFKNQHIPVRPVVPVTRTVHDRAVIEISRGCTRGCRFCQAGILYRPVREKSIKQVIDSAVKTVKNTGYSEIGLLSLSVGDYLKLPELVKNLKNLNCSLSMPSIRADKVDDEILRYISDREKTGFTIAPEAGSERLRKIINKNLSDENIFKGVEKLFKNKWQLIKLYFMIGLPFENDNDIYEIVRISKELHKMAKSFSKKNRINVSISPFVPKPHTPFQWIGQNSVSEIRRKLNIIKDELWRYKKIRLKWHNPETSLIEAVISRGDVNVSKLIYNVFTEGAYLDAWSDRFDFSMWERAALKSNMNLNEIAEKSYSVNETLPWDFIDTGVKKEFLVKELKNSESGVETPDCRFNKCNGCGICNGKIRNILNEDNRFIQEKLEEITSSEIKNRDYKKIIFKYKKEGVGALIGQIDLTNIIVKALLRTKLHFKFTEGFKPKMKISFSPPPPFGVESHEEYFEVSLEYNANPDNILKKINSYLPQGITVLSWFENSSKINLNKDAISSSYIIKAAGLKFPENRLIEDIKFFHDETEVTVKYENGKHLNIVKLIKENNRGIDPDELLIIRKNFIFKEK